MSASPNESSEFQTMGIANCSHNGGLLISTYAQIAEAICEEHESSEKNHLILTSLGKCGEPPQHRLHGGESFFRSVVNKPEMSELQGPATQRLEESSAQRLDPHSPPGPRCLRSSPADVFVNEQNVAETLIAEGGRRSRSPRMKEALS